MSFWTNDIFSVNEIKLPEGEKDGFQQVTFTLSDDQAETIREALENIKATHTFDTSLNNNSNGNALYHLARLHLERIHTSQQ